MPSSEVRSATNVSRERSRLLERAKFVLHCPKTGRNDAGDIAQESATTSNDTRKRFGSP